MVALCGKAVCSRINALHVAATTGGSLTPDYDKKKTSYDAVVPPNLSQCKFVCSKVDAAVKVLVNGKPSTEMVPLASGETKVDVLVTAADKKTTKTYCVTVYKDRLSMRPDTVEPLDSRSSCPLCLSILHRPHKALPQATLFCSSCLSTATRGTPLTPLTRELITSVVRDKGAETKMDGIQVRCPWACYGCKEVMPYSGVGSHVATCEFLPAQCELSHRWLPASQMEEHLKDSSMTCPQCSKKISKADEAAHKAVCYSGDSCPKFLEHKIETRSWEKQFREAEQYQEKDAVKVMKNGAAKETKYLKVSQKGGKLARKALREVLATYAHGPWTGSGGDVAKVHLRCGLAIEELYHLSLRHPVIGEDDIKQEDVLQDQGSDINKEDDIKAICKLWAVPASAPLTDVLVAIDTEFKKLLSEGNSERADYVQGLYAFKAQQSKMSSGAAQEISPGDKFLGQALAKYKDSAAADPSNGMAYFYIGRCLLLLNRVEDALQRFKMAWGIMPQHSYSRMLMHLCEAKLNPKSTGVLQLIASQFDSLFVSRLLQQVGAIKTKSTLYAECAVGDLDIIVLSGLSQVCNALHQNGLTAEARKIAGNVAASVPDQLFLHKRPRKDKNGNFSAHYLALESALINAHYTMMETAPTPNESIAIGVALSKLIECFNSRNSPSVLDAMRRIAHKGIVLMPRNVPLLTTLGLSQLAEYDRTFSAASAPGTTQFVQASKTLDDADASFRAAIAMERQPLAGEPSDFITGQSWWGKMHKGGSGSGSGSGDKKKPVGKAGGAATKAGGRQPAGRSTRTGTSRVGGSKTTTPARTTPARTTPAPRAGRRAVGVSKPAEPAKKVATTARAGRRSQPVTATPTGRNAAKSKTVAAASKQPIAGRRASATKAGRTPVNDKKPVSKTGAKAPTAKADASGSDTPASTAAPGEPVNGDAHDARLGLARVLNRRINDGVGKGLKVGSLSVEAETASDQMVQLYTAVISAKPELHDAIIELGEHQAKTDPMGAVETYSKFPFKDPPTFDDGYIHGEIVRFLMKEKVYADERLERHLIGFARVNGVNQIDKEIKILDEQFKYSKMLMRVYAAAQGKAVDDPDLTDFFKLKMWM